ncbi:lactadherin-like [Styela clava]
MRYTLIKTGIGFVLLAQCVLCHMPTVYEFCTHVVANGEPIHQLTCDSSQCQGRPGKTGPHGPKGSIGVKGEKGERGTTEHLVEERISELEDFQATTSRILEALPKSTYCYMGVRNRDVPDSAMTSFSIAGGGYEAYNGRLDNQISSGNHAVWAAVSNRQGEWLQIDFGTPKLIGGIITQGRPIHSQWVRSFKISCGSSTSSLTTIKHNNSDKIFPGNLDRDSKVINMFTAPITCRYIRVHPESWYGHISMRVEFINGLCHGMAL